MTVVFASAGCQTLSAIGLPIDPGPYQLSDSARLISESHTRPAAMARELNEEVLPQFAVDPGDTLYLEPAKFDSAMRLPADQPVQLDGTISVGRFGRVHVAGMTIPQIKDVVESQIRAIDGEKAEEVIVRLVDWKSKVFYVMGEVNSPGAYPLNGSETFLDAIIAAGDITRRANRHRIVLSRPTGACEPRMVLPVCYDNVIQLGDSSTNYQIRPGDRIFVPSTGLMDDIKQSLFHFSPQNCPRCASPQRALAVSKINCGHSQNCTQSCPQACPQAQPACAAHPNNVMMTTPR